MEGKTNARPKEKTTRTSKEKDSSSRRKVTGNRKEIKARWKKRHASPTPRKEKVTAMDPGKEEETRQTSPSGRGA